MRRPLRAVRAPLQERSQQSLERILDASEQLIEERGFDALTVGEVVQRSRTSVGTFYARFNDKTALLRAVHDRVLSRLEATFDARLQAPSSSDSLAAAVEDEVTCFMGLVVRDAPLIRVFGGQVGDQVMDARAARARRHHFEAFRTVLLKHRPEIRHPDPESAIRFAFGVCSTISLSLGDVERTPDATCVADMGAELSRMLSGYLRGDGEARVRARRQVRGK